jgi:hypothetical protein
MSMPGIEQPRWRKSRRSNENQACVEIALGAMCAGVRDSKNPNGGVLLFGTNQWKTLRSGIATGQFDIG